MVVILGGHVRGSPPALDVLVVHLDTLRIARRARAGLCILTSPQAGAPAGRRVTRTRLRQALPGNATAGQRAEARAGARRPEVAGAAPPPRMCHATARVAPPAGSRLGGLVAVALRPLGRDPAAGALLATFGGCSPHSEAYSGDSLEARPALVPLFLVLYNCRASGAA